MGSRKQLWTGLSLAFAALLTIAMISYQSITQSALDRQWVLHTHQVLMTLGLVRADMLLAETSQRGFILSDDISHMTAYGDAKINCQQNLAALRSLTVDNPAQQNFLDRLAP